MRPPKKASQGFMGLMIGRVLANSATQGSFFFCCPTHIPRESRYGIPGLEDSDDVPWWYVEHHPCSNDRDCGTVRDDWGNTGGTHAKTTQELVDCVADFVEAFHASSATRDLVFALVASVLDMLPLVWKRIFLLQPMLLP